MSKSGIRVPEADLYYMLVCCAVPQLPERVLAYAKGNEPATIHGIRRCGFAIRCNVLDLFTSETGLQKMAEAAADRTVKWEVVLLLGSPKAVAAGRLGHKSIWDLSWIVQGQAIGHDEYVRRVQEIGRMRNEFYECARSDLGIESGSLSPGDRWWFPPGGGLPAGGREPLDSSGS